MNGFLAGFAVASAGLILLGFALDYAHRNTRRRLSESWSEFATAIRDEYDCRLQDEVGRRFIAEATALMERRQRIVAERECTKFRTALRGELQRQARAELIRPDEPAGVATVLEFTATGRGRRSK